MADITSPAKLNKRRERSYPRVVKRARHNHYPVKKPGQRACNETNDQGKFCGGHLKRWFYAADVLEHECGCVEKAWGSDREVYRCEFCQTLYLPNSEDERGMNVAGPGQLSIFGFVPKERK